MNARAQVLSMPWWILMVSLLGIAGAAVVGGVFVVLPMSGERVGSISFFGRASVAVTREQQAVVEACGAVAPSAS